MLSNLGGLLYTSCKLYFFLYTPVWFLFVEEHNSVDPCSTYDCFTQFLFYRPTIWPVIPQHLCVQLVFPAWVLHHTLLNFILFFIKLLNLYNNFLFSRCLTTYLQFLLANKYTKHAVYAIIQVCNENTEHNWLLHTALQISCTAPFSFGSELGRTPLRYSYLTRFVFIIWWFHLEDTSPWVRKEHLLCLSYPQESFACFRRKLDQLDVIFFPQDKSLLDAVILGAYKDGWLAPAFSQELKSSLIILKKKLRQAFCKRKDRTMSRQTRHVLWPYSLIPNKTHRQLCYRGFTLIPKKRHLQLW